MTTYPAQTFLSQVLLEHIFVIWNRGIQASSFNERKEYWSLPVERMNEGIPINYNVGDLLRERDSAKYLKFTAKSVDRMECLM